MNSGFKGLLGVDVVVRVLVFATLIVHQVLIFTIGDAIDRLLKGQDRISLKGALIIYIKTRIVLRILNEGEVKWTAFGQRFYVLKSTGYHSAWPDIFGNQNEDVDHV